MTIADVMKLAIERHQAGNLAEAESLYRQILSQDPNHADALHLLGVLAMQAGHSAAALELMQRAITINPSVPDFHSNLGLVLRTLHRFDEAQAACERAIALRPEYPEAWNNLGNLFRDRKQPDRAMPAFHRALAIRPDYPEAISNLGNCLHELGRDDEAEVHYRRALELHPQNAGYHCNLGAIYCNRRQFDQSIAFFRRAIELAPNIPEAHLNLANALRESGRIPQALVEHQRALTLSPENPEAWFSFAFTLREAGDLDRAIHAGQMALKFRPDYGDALANLSAAFQEKGLFDQAIETARRAIALSPNFAGAYLNLGNALRDKGIPDEAMSAYRRALEIQPDFAEALSSLALCCKERGLFEESVALAGKALAVRPDLPAVHNNAAVIYKDQGRITEALAEFDIAIRLKPTAILYSNRLYISHFLPDLDPEDFARRHFEFGRLFAARDPIPPHTNDPNPNRLLRIGYVSGDFRFHSVAFFLYPLLKCRDRRQFQIACYPTDPRSDAITKSIRQLVDHWLPIYGMSDDQAAQIIRRDGIDILVDLTGHTSSTRLPLFTRKPAPVQATYLGYPNTTGLPTMDWRITDAIADPPGSERFYSEKLLRLPHTTWCYYPLSGSPPVSPLPALTTGHVTFGCFNDMAKINAPLVQTWATILNQVPNSRLILKNRGVSTPSLYRPLQQTLADAGISSDRIDFLPRLPQPVDHLNCYNNVDIALDTFPYHGTTTTCEALWMGVPVVTREGTSHVSRVGASLLTALGMTDLITADEAHYIQTAISLSRDLPRLADWRSKSRQRMQSSPLMDAPQMTRDLESAYRRIWQNWVTNR